ncbi:MAG: LLM class flavin-dependent oxidoreductase, partial [Acidimicrobiales bacterium]
LGEARPTVWMGAVGDQMLGLAGEIADGLITHPTNSHPVELAERLLPKLGEGAARVPRAVPPVVASPMTVTGRDAAAVDEAGAVARRRLAFLYSTPAYRPTLELLGFDDLGPRLRELVRADAWDDLAALLPNSVLEQVVPVAPWSELPELLVERYRSLVDGVVVRPPDDESDDDEFAAVVVRLARS